MKSIKNPEFSILSMKIYDQEAKGYLKDKDKKLTKEQLENLDEQQLQEIKKAVRLQKLDVYQKYQRFKKLLNVYNRYQHTKNFTNLLKVTDPVLVLDKLYRDEGLNNEPNIDEEYRNLKKAVEQAKSENPDVDINDITSQKTRAVMSDIINQTQNKGKELIPADLDFVAVIEGYGLYKAISEIEAGKDRESIKKKYEITEEMLKKGEIRVEEFNQKEIVGMYQRANCDKNILLTAGALEINPGEAQRDLESFGEIEPKAKEPIAEDCLLIKRREPQMYVIDAFYRRYEEYAPSSQNMQLVKQSIENYLNEIEQWNKEQEAEEKKYRKAKGKPSPRFLRELKEYQEEQAQEQAKGNVLEIKPKDTEIEFG